MKKYYKIILVLLCMVTSFVFTSCNDTNNEESFYRELSENIIKTDEAVSDALTTLQSAESYTYSTEIYYEEMHNFDYENRKMPEDDKLWYKPVTEYTYTKVGADSYLKVVFTDMHFEDEEAVGDTPVTMEVWNIGGVETIKIDGQVRANLDGVTENLTAYYHTNLALDYLTAYADNTSFYNGVFIAETTKFFGKEVSMYQTYSVTGIGQTEKVFYRDSPLASGYDEDLKFDWANTQFVNINTFCSTQKREKVTLIEFYTETIASYNKTNTQIWNNETVTTWYGDRINASSSIIEITYGTHRSPITLNAL